MELDVADRGAVVDDAAVLHPHHALGGIGDWLVVGDEQDRLTTLVQAAEQLEDLFAALAVECAGRLVGEHQRRLVGQRPGDGQPLTLTARQHAGRLLGLVTDAEQVEQVAGTRLGALALAAGDDGRHDHVLQHRHAFEEVEELEHDADVLAAHDRQSVLVHPGQ